MYNDVDILKLFSQRSENAIRSVQEKYGSLCRKIAYGILKNNEDTEECIDTAYLCVWNAIPPAKPESLRAYLCKTVRNGAFEMYKKNRLHSCDASLSELEELISDDKTVERYFDGAELARHINKFLGEQTPENRKIFMGRYYFNMSNKEIGEKLRMSETAVKTRLSRIRGSLKGYLSDSGIFDGKE